MHTFRFEALLRKALKALKLCYMTAVSKKVVKSFNMPLLLQLVQAKCKWLPMVSFSLQQSDLLRQMYYIPFCSLQTMNIDAITSNLENV